MEIFWTFTGPRSKKKIRNYYRGKIWQESIDPSFLGWKNEIPFCVKRACVSVLSSLGANLRQNSNCVLDLTPSLNGEQSEAAV